MEKGQATAKQCQACHTFEKGGPNRVGPNLWGIVGRPRASERAASTISAAMKAKGGNWTFDELYKFLANPRGYIPGTNMTFAGLSRGQQRADVIDFLHTLSDSPLPLPKAAEAMLRLPAARRRNRRSRPSRRSRRLQRPRRRRSDVGHRAIVTRPGKTRPFCA